MISQIAATSSWYTSLVDFPIKYWVCGFVAIAAWISWKVYRWRHEKRRSETIAELVPKSAYFNRRASSIVKILANRFQFVRDNREAWSGMNMVEQEVSRIDPQRSSTIYVLDYRYRIWVGDSEGRSRSHRIQNMILINHVKDWPELLIKSKAWFRIPDFGLFRQQQPTLETSRCKLYLKPDQTIDRKFAEAIIERLESLPGSFVLESYSDAIFICVYGKSRFLSNDARFEPEQIPELLEFALDMDQLGCTYLTNQIVNATLVNPTGADRGSQESSETAHENQSRNQ